MNAILALGVRTLAFSTRVAEIVFSIDINREVILLKHWINY